MRKFTVNDVLRMNFNLMYFEQCCQQMKRIREFQTSLNKLLILTQPGGA